MPAPVRKPKPASSRSGGQGSAPVRSDTHSPTGAGSRGASYAAGPAITIAAAVQAEADEETKEPVQAEAEEETKESVESEAEKETKEPVQAEADDESQDPLQQEAPDRDVQARSEEDVEQKSSEDDALAKEAPEPVQQQVQREDDEQSEEDAPSVQQASQSASSAAAVHSVAAEGVAGASAQLPGQSRIQRAFGRHDISDTRVSIGDRAAAANRKLGSRAYTRGNRIAFKDKPNLHLAAHEAAHVVQQNRGVRLKRGVGKPGDAYEQQADRAADAVVECKSAEGILDESAGAEKEAGVQAKCSCGGSGCAACGGGGEAEDQESVQAQLEVNAVRNVEAEEEKKAPAEEAAEQEAEAEAEEEVPAEEESEESKGEGEAEGEAEGEGTEDAEAEAESDSEGGDAEPESEADEPDTDTDERADAEPAGVAGAGEDEKKKEPESTARTRTAVQAAPAGGGAGAVGGAGGAAGGAANAECYDANVEEPDEEPDEEPADPPATEAEENMDSETPEAEEEDNCPVGKTVAAEAEAATPSEGVAGETGPGAGEGGGAAGGAGGAGEGGAAGGGGGAGAGAAAAEGDKMAEAGGGGEAGGKEAALSPVEDAIAETEEQRGAAVTEYNLAEMRLQSSSQGVSQLAGFEIPGGGREMAAVNARVQGFFRGATSRAEQSAGLAGQIPAHLGPKSEALKGEVDGAMAEAKAAIEARSAASRSKVTAEADAARSHIESEHAATVSALEAATSEAINTLNAEADVTISQVSESETAGLDQINSLYADGRTTMEQIGVTIGSQAHAKGEAYAGVYEGCKIHKKDSFWSGHLTDRRAEAQQNAARETAKGYKESLEKAAKDQAREAMKGRQKDRCAVIEAAGKARDTIDSQRAGIIASLEAGLQSGIQSAGATRAELLASVNKAEKSTHASIDEQEEMQMQSVDDTGHLQKVAIEQAAHASTASLQNTVADAMDLMQEGLGQISGVLADLGSADSEQLEPVLDNMLGAVGGALQSLDSAVGQGSTGAEERLAATGAGALEAIANITTSNAEQADALESGFSDSMSQMSEGATTTFSQQAEQHTTQAQTATTQGVDSFKQALDGFNETVTTVQGNIETTLGEAADKLQEGLDEEFAKIDDEIPKQAREAASKEQPAWKTVVAVILIIAVIIVVALVIGPAVIGAVGAAAGALGASAGAAATIGTIVGGAIVGAAASATITVINNWRTGQDLTTGVVEAAIMGAIGGALGAGAGALAQVAGNSIRALSGPIAQFALNIAGDAVIEIGTQLVTTGDFNLEAFGQAMAISVLTAGFGEIPAVKRVQARVQTRASSLGKPRVGADVGTPRASTESPDSSPTARGGDEGGPAPPASRTESDAPSTRTESDADGGTGARSESDAETRPAPRSESDAETGTAPRAESDAETGTAPRAELDAETGAAPKSADSDGGSPVRPADTDSVPSKSSHADEPEIEPGVVAKSSDGDHKVKVLPDGRVIACSSCGEMRLKYANELAANPKLKSELDRIEAIPDAKTKADESLNLRKKLDAAQEAGAEPPDVVGARIAEDAGLPGAPEGYHWAKTEDGGLTVRRSPGHGDAGPPLRFEPETGRFRPEPNPPKGYHWAETPSGFTVKRNPGTSGTAPRVEYDAPSGKFIDTDTGTQYSPPVGPGQRPGWRQSELDVGADLIPKGYAEQPSFLKHPNGDVEVVPYGTPGSTRPDFYKPNPPPMPKVGELAPPGTSVDVKNYDVSTPQARQDLVQNAGSQAKDRAAILPPGSKQTLEIDVRGQNITPSQITQLKADIAKASGGAISASDINVKM